MLLTRPPLDPKSPFDLHVLGTPPAFILSQDQTLQIRLVINQGLGSFELGAQSKKFFGSLVAEATLNSCLRSHDKSWNS